MKAKCHVLKFALLISFSIVIGSFFKFDRPGDPISWLQALGVLLLTILKERLLFFRLIQVSVNLIFFTLPIYVDFAPS